MSKTFFETIKAVDGEIFNLLFHQERYESVLKHFGIKDVQDLSLYLNPPKNGLYRCRVVYEIFKDFYNIDVEYYEYKKKNINSLKLINSDISYEFKSTSRAEIDELYAFRDGCDDILIVKNSLLTDTSIANIAFFDSTKWITPAQPLLRGTTRERLLVEGKIVEAEIFVDDLVNFSKVALMNAMIDFDIIQKKAKDLCVR
jgi:4-amino-4-deoxychorismate lyase